MNAIENETFDMNKIEEKTSQQGKAIQSSEIAIIDENTIRNKIYRIRGQQVMLDFELAAIYGYSTKAFNQQVRRNIVKFDGDDFMFQLTDEETKTVSRSQIVTLNKQGRGRNLKYNPYAFTEQGVYMLMTVLKGELATRQSKALIRLFKKMKDNIVEMQDLATQRDLLKLSMQITDNTKAIQDAHVILGKQNKLFTEQQKLLMEHEDKLSSALEQIGETVKKSEISPVLLQFRLEEQTEILILNGQAVTADVAYIDIYSKAKKSIYIIDDYINVKTLRLLQGVRTGVAVTVFSDNRCGYLHESDYQDFQTEFPTIPITFITTAESVHDRYIVLDYEEPKERIFLCGASSKDAGVKKMSTIIEIQSEIMKDSLHTAIDQLKCNPSLKLR